MTGVVTIVAKHFLPFARVLGASLARHHPQARFAVVVVDDPDGCYDPAAEPFEVVPLEALGIPGLRRVRFSHGRQQMAIAAKPFALAWLLDAGCDAALFLDADMWLLDDASGLLEHVAAHPITLVPHLVAPVATDDGAARDLVMLRAGTFNGGIVGVTEGAPARELLAWWQQRLLTHCRSDVEEGMYFDQRWLDLAPALFGPVGVFRDPGYNVAHWNLPERPVRYRDERFHAGEGLCRLFHFSGLEPDDEVHISRFRPDLGRNDIGDAWLLVDRYRAALVDAGWYETRRWPYGYDRFDNGVPVPPLARRLYGELQDAERFGDPFATREPGSFYAWLRAPAGPASAPDLAVTNLWLGAHRQREDLQHAYPDPLGTDRARFLGWIETTGVPELGLGGSPWVPPWMA